MEAEGGYGVASNRNALANKAVDAGFEYLLFVDNDIIVPENSIDALIECMKKTNSMVTTGWYKSQYYGDVTSAAHYSAEKNSYEQYTLKEIQEKWDEYFLIDGNGLGLALINTAVFGKLSYPYFNFLEYPSKQCLSEDLFFFDALRQLGEKSYAIRSLRAGHIKSVHI